MTSLQEQRKHYATFLEPETTLDALIKRTERVWMFDDFRLSDFTITTNLVASGGFADIYDAQHVSGEPFVLKLYHRKEQRSEVENYSGDFRRAMNTCVRNAVDFSLAMRNYRDISPIILPVLANDLAQCSWFLIPKSTGIRVTDHINDAVTRDEQGKILQKYMQVLAFLHKNDYGLVDHNWGNCLLTRSQGDAFSTTVDWCDVDGVVDLHNQYLSPSCYPHTISHELLHAKKVTKMSDVESCAKMICWLLTKTPFPRTNFYTTDEFDSEAQKKSWAVFKSVINNKLPASITSVLRGALVYPRSSDVTIDSFAQVLEQEYQIEFPRIEAQQSIRDIAEVKKKAADEEEPPF